MKQKKFLFAFLFLLYGFSNAQELCGQWNFKAITNLQGDSLLSISDADYMEIHSDGTFHYELAAKNNLIAQGTWLLQNNILCYNYKLPKDTTRCYSIKLQEHQLRLNEGEISFSFQRNQASSKK